jgi:hypothetical protein
MSDRLDRGAPTRGRRGSGAASALPVRLLAPGVPSPFAPGRDVTFARVSGDGPVQAGLRDGDHVALVRRDRAREGTVASVLAPDGTETLYRFPEERPPQEELAEEALTLDPRHDDLRRIAPRRRPRVRGVVVGVLRKLAISA